MSRNAGERETLSPRRCVTGEGVQNWTKVIHEWQEGQIIYICCQIILNPLTPAAFCKNAFFGHFGGFQAGSRPN